MSLIVARFTRGTRVLNINDLTSYELGTDFTPPAVSFDPVYARGGSDWMSAGKLVGVKAQNRSFSFGVHVYGSTEAKVRMRIRTLNDFIISGTQTEPVYLEVLGNSDFGYQPLWGQNGAYYRYEVLTGYADAGQYAVGGIRDSSLPECTVNLTIAPYALGKQQRLALAIGSIIEDVLGAADGLSRGVTIGSAHSNYFTNPVFGHTTWNTNWTAGSDMVEDQNIDQTFTLPGRRVSAKLISPTNGTNIYTEALTASGAGLTWTISLYVMLPNKDPVKSTHCAVYYGGAKTSTYQNMGNGIWRVYATVTTLAPATAVGIRVYLGYTVFLLGAQVEADSYPTPLIHGDMLGCTWAGTRHASVTTSTAGSMYVYSRGIFNMNQGTLRVVWKPDRKYDAYAANVDLFSDSASKFDCYYDSTNHYFVFIDAAGNPTATSTVSFSANTPIVLHFTWGDDSYMNVYYNGAAILTNGPYNMPATIPLRLYIGSNAASANQCLGVFMGFTSWDIRMTAAQVLADYTNQAGIVAADKRVDWIPYMATTVGGGVIYNEYLAGSWGKWGAINGVPGSLPAETEWNGTLSSDWSSIKSLWLSLLDTDIYIKPQYELNGDSSGSADVACEGDAYESNTVNTSECLLVDGPTPSREYFSAIAGREYALFVRLQDGTGASGLTACNRVEWLTEYYSSDFMAVTSSTSWRTWISPFLSIPPLLIERIGTTLFHNCNYMRAVPKRTAGSWALKVDYAMAMFRPLCRLRSSGNVTQPCFNLRGRDAIVHASTPYYMHERLDFKGDVIELIPERWNILSVHMGDTDFDPLVTYTVTFNYITITPRWGLL